MDAAPPHPCAAQVPDGRGGHADGTADEHLAVLQVGDQLQEPVGGQRVVPAAADGRDVDDPPGRVEPFQLPTQNNCTPSPSISDS